MAKSLGIIGLGWFASLIAQSVSERPSKTTVLAGCDISPSKREEFKKRFNIKKVYDNAEDLINDADVDIVVIATPPYLHAELGKKALLAKKHVFFEKPGALTPNEMSELINIALKTGSKTTIDYVMRRNPLYLVLKRLCESNTFGLLERANLENYAHDDHMPPQHWFWDYSKSGGIWVEHGVHFFDIVNWLIGPAKSMRAVNLLRAGEKLTDRVLGFTIHDNDTIVSYYHGFTKPEAIEQTTFYFTFERAYAQIHGWIPTKLVIDALSNPDIDYYLKGPLLDEAKRFLPNTEVELSIRETKSYGQSGMKFAGRGKSFCATSRILYEYNLRQNRWEVYRLCVMQGIHDLIDSIEGEKFSPDVTLYDAHKSLEVAYGMEQYEKRKNTTL